MLQRIKRFVAWCLIVFGVLFALMSFIPMEEQSARQGATSVFVFGLLLVAIGLLLFYIGSEWHQRHKIESASYNPSGTIKKGKPVDYSTKNCPECEQRLPLDAEACPECGKKQKKDDSTCSGGVGTAAKARSEFAEARRTAKKVKSPGYIWRTANDGSVCERCAANNGHRFSWDEEPPGGHAGAKARCRCYPETIAPKD